MRHRSIMSAPHPGRCAVAVGVAFGLTIMGCSSRASTVSSEPGLEDSGGHMAIHASRSPTENGPEPGESFAAPPAPTIPVGTRVPDIRRMEFEEAVMTLRALGMDFGLVTARASAEKQWLVLEQWPAPGSRPPAEGRVSMTVSMGGDSGGGIAGVGGVTCRPEEDDIDEPYCLGKAFRY